MEQTKIILTSNCSDNAELVLEEITTKTGQRLVAICNGRQQINATADEAEALGLALIRMATEAKIRGVADDAFKSTMPPIRTRLQGITDRRAILRGPHRRLDDKRRARLGVSK